MSDESQLLLREVRTWRSSLSKRKGLIHICTCEMVIAVVSGRLALRPVYDYGDPVRINTASVLEGYLRDEMVPIDTRAETILTCDQQEDPDPS